MHHFIKTYRRDCLYVPKHLSPTLNREAPVSFKRPQFRPYIGRTNCQPDLTTFLQPRHILTQGYNITQTSAPDDGHMVARNMLSNY